MPASEYNIVMIKEKYCPKCNSFKNPDEFGKLSSSKDGLSYSCKECLRNKMKTWFSKPENRKRHNSGAAKYRRTELGKATKQRYYNSEKGQKVYKKYSYQKTNGNKARQAVNHAVDYGTIPRVNTQVCQVNDGTCEGRMEYHHHKGYKKEFWLDVIPLCKKHHCIADGRNFHSTIP